MPSKLTELETAKLAAITEQLRGRAAAEFFSDPGLPPDLQKDLQEGWAVLEERRRERAKAGVPLPPGGCLILGERAVVGQCMADFHNRLAEHLGVAVEAVRLRREGIRVLADVALPEGWPRGAPGNVRAAVITQGLVSHTIGAGAEFFSGELALDNATIGSYVRSVVGMLNEIHREELRERLEAVRTVRSELVPKERDGD